MTQFLLAVEVVGVGFLVAIALFGTVGISTSAYCAIIEFINR